MFYIQKGHLKLKTVIHLSSRLKFSKSTAQLEKCHVKPKTAFWKYFNLEDALQQFCPEKFNFLPNSCDFISMPVKALKWPTFSLSQRTIRASTETSAFCSLWLNGHHLPPQSSDQCNGVEKSLRIPLFTPKKPKCL